MKFLLEVSDLVPKTLNKSHQTKDVRWQRLVLFVLSSYSTGMCLFYVQNILFVWLIFAWKRNERKETGDEMKKRILSNWSTLSNANEHQIDIIIRNWRVFLLSQTGIRSGCYWWRRLLWREWMVCVCVCVCVRVCVWLFVAYIVVRVCVMCYKPHFRNNVLALVRPIFLLLCFVKKKMGFDSCHFHQY